MLARDTSTPDRQSADDRQAKSPAGGLLLVLLCALALASCAQQQRSAMAWTTLTGDLATLSKFEGRWYDYSGVMRVEVGVGRPSHLSLRVSPVFTIADGRTANEEIHFSFQRGEWKTELSLRLLADDVLVVIPPGSEPSWFNMYTPVLTQPTVNQLLVRKATKLMNSMSQTLNWLIDML